MSGHQFTFPPPPPPPPQASANQIGSHGSSGGNHLGYNRRGGGGNRAFSRGRGRGGPHNGLGANYGRAGGWAQDYQIANGQSSSYGGYPSSATGHGTGFPLPPYVPFQQSQHHISYQNGYNYVNSTYPSLGGVHSSNYGHYNNTHGYPHQPGSPAFNATYYDPSQQQLHGPPQDPSTFNQGLPPSGNFNYPPKAGQSTGSDFQSTSREVHQNSSHYELHRPPVPKSLDLDRNGLQRNSRTGSHHLPNPLQSSNATRLQNHRGRITKRGHQEGFSRPKNRDTKTVAKSEVAPAVPSFGIPLPVKPPVPQETGRNIRKKKRRHNQLGLTPKTFEHESSEEEDNDGDEEAKLAAVAGLPGPETQQIKFTYKGRTSVLQSPSDVAAWIEERKKRFPTKARIQEKKEHLKQEHEQRRAAKQARETIRKQSLAQKENARGEARAKHKDEEENASRLKDIPKYLPSENSPGPIKKESEEPETQSNMAAEKAKRKFEKLRRRLEREHRRIAKVEAQMSRLERATAANDHQTLKEAASLNTADKEDSEDTSRDADGQKEHSSEIKLEEEVSPAFDEQKSPKEALEITEKAPPPVAESPEEMTKLEVQALEVSKKTFDPLTPTSQPSIHEISLHDADNSTVLVAAEAPSTIPDVPDQSNLQLHDFVMSSCGEVGPSSLRRQSESTASPSMTLTDASDDESTSSGTSSSTSSSSTDSEHLPTKRTEFERVPRPKRTNVRTMCRNFVQHGHCKKGDACRFNHRFSDRGRQGRLANRRRGQAIPAGRKQRIGLYQRMVEQEKRTEAERLKEEREQASEGMVDVRSIDEESPNHAPHA